LRVVAASKIDLGDPRQRGDFREDLYYRLNVVTISIPPLKERRDDIPLLFGYFAERAASRFKRDVPAIPSSIHRHLREYDWPGNVRELSHFAERFVLGVGQASDRVPASEPETDGTLSLPDRLERYEAHIIREALNANDGDVRRTIADLGIPRKTFYDKLQRHGIVRSDFASSDRS